jgi:hypothetical protein
VFVNRRCLGETHRNTGRSSPMAASLKSLRYYCNAQLPCLHLLMALAALLLVSFSIYLPYNNTFLLDEYYDGNGLRELTRQDKLTIRYAIHLPQPPSSYEPFRVQISEKNIPQIKKFVEHYSMCSCVHEIKIVVPEEHLEKYQSIKFIYEHTHSLVTSVEATIEETIKWETESLMLLDPHVFVSCDDLRFSLSVWQSSYDSLVGYFPRSHTSSHQFNDR